MRKSLSFKLTVFATNVLLCGLDLELSLSVVAHADRCCCKTSGQCVECRSMHVNTTGVKVLAMLRR